MAAGGKVQLGLQPQLGNHTFDDVSQGGGAAAAKIENLCPGWQLMPPRNGQRDAVGNVIDGGMVANLVAGGKVKRPLLLRRAKQ